MHPGLVDGADAERHVDLGVGLVVVDDTVIAHAEAVVTGGPGVVAAPLELEHEREPRPAQRHGVGPRHEERAVGPSGDRAVLDGGDVGPITSANSAEYASCSWISVEGASRRTGSRATAIATTRAAVGTQERRCQRSASSRAASASRITRAAVATTATAATAAVP